MLSLIEVTDNQDMQFLFQKKFLLKFPNVAASDKASEGEEKRSKPPLFDTNNFLYWQAINKPKRTFDLGELKNFIVHNQHLDSMCKNFCLLFISLYFERQLQKLDYSLVEKIVTQLLMRKDISIIDYENEMITDTFQLFFCLFVKNIYREFVKNCVYFPNKKIKLLNFDENIQKHHQNTSLTTTTFGLDKSIVHFLLNLRFSKNNS